MWRHEPVHRRGIAYSSPDLGRRYPQRARPAPVQRETRWRAPEARREPRRDETPEFGPRQDHQHPQGRGRRDN